MLSLAAGVKKKVTKHTLLSLLLVLFRPIYSYISIHTDFVLHAIWTIYLLNRGVIFFMCQIFNIEPFFQKRKNIVLKPLNPCFLSTLIQNNYFEVFFDKSGTYKSKCALYRAQIFVYFTWIAKSQCMDNLYVFNWAKELAPLSPENKIAKFSHFFTLYYCVLTPIYQILQSFSQFYPVLPSFVKFSLSSCMVCN